MVNGLCGDGHGRPSPHPPERIALDIESERPAAFDEMTACHALISCRSEMLPVISLF
ncbi:MAG: hypothetical protein NT143_00070 [Actinobacteria bacterium]|nr:hypothetical protein [Actinomycetota bacterium]